MNDFVRLTLYIPLSDISDLQVQTLHNKALKHQTVKVMVRNRAVEALVEETLTRRRG